MHFWCSLGEFWLASPRSKKFEVHGPERKIRRVNGHMIIDRACPLARRARAFIGRAFGPRAGACSPGLEDPIFLWKSAENSDFQRDSTTIAKKSAGDPFQILKILYFLGDFLMGNQVKMCDFLSFPAFLLSFGDPRELYIPIGGDPRELWGGPPGALYSGNPAWEPRFRRRSGEVGSPPTGGRISH